MAESKISMRLSEEEALAIAIKEAKKGQGHVEPNPPVACVILDSEYHFLAKGYHKKYGEPHAETEALNKIKDKKKLEGAHVFVTMEPCHHQGKTGACSKALAELPIASLTYSVKDPFTRGKGCNFLRKRGIKVNQSRYFKKEIEELVRPFTFSLTENRPFISLKVASSLDGIIACKNKKWITSEKARKHSHTLRARHSAILIGLNTLLKDNPRLNIREAPFKNKKIKVIVLDPHCKSLSFLPKSHLLKLHEPANIIICCSKQKATAASKKKAQALGINLKPFKLSNKKPQVFNLKSLLKTLHKEEKLQSIMVEGGGFSLSQFLEAGLAQKLYLYMSPQIIGEGLSWTKGISKALSLQEMQTHPVGEDELLFEATF